MLSPAQIMLADMLISKVIEIGATLKQVEKMSDEEAQAKILEMNERRGEAVSVIRNRQES